MGTQGVTFLMVTITNSSNSVNRQSIDFKFSDVVGQGTPCKNPENRQISASIGWVMPPNCKQHPCIWHTWGQKFKFDKNNWNLSLFNAEFENEVYYFEKLILHLVLRQSCTVWLGIRCKIIFFWKTINLIFELSVKKYPKMTNFSYFYQIWIFDLRYAKCRDDVSNLGA